VNLKASGVSNAGVPFERSMGSRTFGAGSAAASCHTDQLAEYRAAGTVIEVDRQLRPGNTSTRHLQRRRPKPPETGVELIDLASKFDCVLKRRWRKGPCRASTALSTPISQACGYNGDWLARFKVPAKVLIGRVEAPSLVPCPRPARTPLSSHAVDRGRPRARVGGPTPLATHNTYPRLTELTA